MHKQHPLLTAGQLLLSIRQDFLSASSKIDKSDLLLGNRTEPIENSASWDCLALDAPYFAGSWSTSTLVFKDQVNTLGGVFDDEVYSITRFGWLKIWQTARTTTELRRSLSGDLLAEISFSDEKALHNREDVLEKKISFFRPDFSVSGIVYQYLYCPKDVTKLESLRASLWPHHDGCL